MAVPEIVPSEEPRRREPGWRCAFENTATSTANLGLPVVCSFFSRWRTDRRLLSQSASPSWFDKLHDRLEVNDGIIKCSRKEAKTEGVLELQPHYGDIL